MLQNYVKITTKDAKYLFVYKIMCNSKNWEIELLQNFSVIGRTFL